MSTKSDFNANIPTNSLTPEEAFKLGTREVSQYPIIFIDPDSSVGIEAQMNSQVADSYRTVVEKMMEGTNTVSRGSFQDSQDFDEVMREKDMAAFSVHEVDGKEYGVVIMPKDSSCTKEGFYGGNVRLLSRSHDANWDEKTVSNIVENIPGTPQELMRFAGNHEGSHLNGDRFANRDVYETANEEARADNVAIDATKARGEGDVAQGFADVRNLTGHHDQKHLTGPVLGTDNVVGYEHLVTDIKKLGIMDDAASINDSNLSSADANKELLTDHDSYFSKVNEELANSSDLLIEAYKESPDSEALHKGIENFELERDALKNYEGAWRRIVKEEKDFPAHKNGEPLITQEIKDEVAKQAEIEEAKQTLSSSEAEGVTYTGDTDLLQEVSDSGVDVSSDLLVADTQVSANIDQVNNMSLSV